MEYPPSELIAEWKREYDEILSVEMGGHFLVYRSISFDELDQITRSVTKDSSSIDIEDDLVKLAVLWPIGFDPNHYKPGLITTLSNKVKESSCLDGEVYHAIDVLNTWRERMDSLRGEAYSFIMFAMAQYKLEDLHNLTFYRLSELVAISEKVIALRQMAEGVETTVPIRLEIWTPEEIEAWSQQKISKHGNATVADPIAQKLLAAM
jgi:hypothetical protein